MQRTTVRALTLAVAASASLLAQTPATPKYDVVSIKRNLSNALGSNGSAQRPDGGFMMLNIPLGTLVGQAYGIAPIDMVGLPGWVMSERYDVTATSSLERATPDQRTAMLRAMLAERVRLVARVEQREQPVYDLVLARSDGSLGPNIKRSDIDCEAVLAAQRKAATEALASGITPAQPAFTPNMPCVIQVRGDGMEGDQTMAGFSRLFRQGAGREVVDKTGLKGSYRMSLTFDRAGALRGPAAEPVVGAAPSIFTAVQEQLGMKLESSKAMRDGLVIERIERPTEN